MDCTARRRPATVLTGRQETRTRFPQTLVIRSEIGQTAPWAVMRSTLTSRGDDRMPVRTRPAPAAVPTAAPTPPAAQAGERTPGGRVATPRPADVGSPGAVPRPRAAVAAR